MSFQKIELNMIPHGDMPSFYASQYETGRPIIIEVMMGEDAFACDELYIELHCRKVDNNIVTLEPDTVDGNQVTFVGTEQLFACPGKNLCEICLYADETKDTSLGSLNFFIEVEPDPLAGGLESETQIHDLYTQVEEITEQVIGDDYYDKTEVDALLDAKADASTTYTKTEVDTALNLKADKLTTYTKTETNALLAGKADASDTYTKAQVDSKLSLKADKATTYTKTETDTLLGYKADASQVYTRSQTDTLLNNKADKSTTYTKTQVDNALALKANTADLATVATTGDYDDLTNKPTIPAAQVQSDWEQSDNTKVDYIKNKPDLSVYVTSDALGDIIYDLLPAGTASGAVANFDTKMGNVPLIYCKANIVASQPSGTPTPSSPLAISGYTGMSLSVFNKNLITVKNGSGTINGVGYSLSVSDQTITLNGTAFSSGGRTTRLTDVLYLPVGSYRFSVVGTYTSSFILSNADTDAYISGQGTFNISTPTRLFVGTNVVNGSTYDETVQIQIEKGTTTTTYVKPNTTTYPVSWQDEAGTVYGGNLDLTSGVLTVTHGEIDSYNGESINEPWLSSKDVYTEGGTPTTGAQVVYPLTTPVIYQLTPTQIEALLGVNNIYNDTNGDTEVQYKDSIQHYIDTKVGS